MSLMAKPVPVPAVRPVPRRGLIQRCGGIAREDCSCADDELHTVIDLTAHVSTCTALSAVSTSAAEAATHNCQYTQCSKRAERASHAPLSKLWTASEGKRALLSQLWDEIALMRVAISQKML